MASSCSCPICFEEFTDNTVRASPDACDHVFCLPCLEKWSKLGSYCPVDRKRYKKICNLDSESVIQVKPRKRKKQRRVLYDFSTKCEICLKDEDAATLLLCDSCDLGFHTKCLSPPLKEVPAGLWFCPPCISVEARLKEKNGITKEVEAELCSFDQKKLQVNDLKSMQAKALENFKAKCNKNSSLAFNVATEFENVSVKAESCRNVVLEDDEGKLDKITKTFDFLTDNRKRPSIIEKNSRSYSHPVINKKTRKITSRLSRKNRCSQVKPSHSNTDEMCLKDNIIADDDLLDPLPNDVFFDDDMEPDAFSKRDHETLLSSRNDKLKCTTVLPSSKSELPSVNLFESDIQDPSENSNSPNAVECDNFKPLRLRLKKTSSRSVLSSGKNELPSVNLFESLIQDPSDNLSSRDIDDHNRIQCFSSNKSVLRNVLEKTQEELPDKKLVSPEDRSSTSGTSISDESTIDYLSEDTEYNYSLYEVIKDGAETSAFQPPSNNPNIFIPSSSDGDFSKKKSKKKDKKKDKKRDKNKSPKKKHKKKNKEMSSKKKHRKKHKEVISEKKHKKNISKSKEYVLMDHFENHKNSLELDTNAFYPNYKRNISDSNSYSLNKSYEADISTSDYSSALALVKAEKQQHSTNTFNLHLYCGNEESKLNDTHQKSCSCNHCVSRNTNTVNLHLHCKSQTLLKISVPEDNCDSDKTNDSSNSCSHDTFCDDSLGLKSKSTSHSKTRNFPEDHERNINKDLFVHYKDLKYLTVLDDGTFVINRPQPKKIKTEMTVLDDGTFVINRPQPKKIKTEMKPERNFETLTECQKQDMFTDNENSVTRNLRRTCRTVSSQKPFRTKRNSAMKPENFFYDGISEDDFEGDYEESVNVKLEDGLYSAAKPYPSGSSSISSSHYSMYNNYQPVSSTITKDEKSLTEFENLKRSKESFSRKDLKHLSIKDGTFVLQLPECESSQSSSEPVSKSSFCTQSKASADISSCSPVHCKKESFSKNDLKHLKINKDGTFYLELSDSQTKKSSSESSASSSQSADFCERNKDLKTNVDESKESFMMMIHENDLERLKVDQDGSLSLEPSNYKVDKPSSESSDSSSHSAPFCEKKSFSKSDLKCLKINKDGTFSLDLSDSKTDKPLSHSITDKPFSDSKTDKPLSDTVDTSMSSASLCEKKSFSKSDLKHLKINKDGTFILEVP